MLSEKGSEGSGRWSVGLGRDTWAQGRIGGSKEGSVGSEGFRGPREVIHGHREGSMGSWRKSVGSVRGPCRRLREGSVCSKQCPWGQGNTIQQLCH